MCPNCKRFIVQLLNYFPSGSVRRTYLVYPRSTSRSPISKDIPNKFAQDFKEACLVLADSPKASAALSRRCLQNILREKAGVKPQNLSKEIDDVLQKKELPNYLAEGIDALRNVGNFAAHPIKSESTGEVVEVEPGEAEWLLDLLEGLFDFYFIQPALLAEKRKALNKKLRDSGKKEMK